MREKAIKIENASLECQEGGFPYIVITLGLPYPLESSRVAVKTEPYPGRWTTHIVIGNVEEIDDELFLWVKQAYHFAEGK